MNSVSNGAVGMTLVREPSPACPEKPPAVPLAKRLVSRLAEASAWRSSSGGRVMVTRIRPGPTKFTAVTLPTA